MNALALRALPRAWPRLPAALRMPVWHCLLAALFSLALLASFHHVVRGAVAQGELRRAATAAHATATWRCNALTSLDLRDGCLTRLLVATRGAVAAPAAHLAE